MIKVGDPIEDHTDLMVHLIAEIIIRSFKE